MNLKKIISEEINSFFDKKKYIGQCDALRRNCDVNENLWHQMMENKKEISIDEFIENVDFSSLIDEDETVESFILDAKKSDPTTAAYISNWGEQECMFFQTAGFEFIFV